MKRLLLLSVLCCHIAFASGIKYDLHNQALSDQEMKILSETEVGGGDIFVVQSAGTDIYIAGSFTTVNGIPAKRVAKWNGTSWSALGSGFNWTAYCIAVIGSDVYVGGDFTTAGGIAAKRIAKWNGTSWSTVGAGFSAALRAFAVNGTDLYAGGIFTDAGTIPEADGIVKINTLNSTYAALSTGTLGTVFSLAITGNSLYAGGSFTQAGGAAATRIAKWDISTNAWSSLGSGIDGTVYTMAVSGTDIYAAGLFNNAGGAAAKNIARWNGSSWGALGSGVSAQVCNITANGTDLYVGGAFTIAGGLLVKRLAKWNGTGWEIVNRDIADCPAIRGMAFTSNNTLFMGGSEIPVTAIRKDTALKIVCETAATGDIHAVVSVGTTTYVAGSFTEINGLSASRIAKWDGTNWTTLGTGLNGTVYSMIAIGNNVYVGGDFTTAGGVAAVRIAKWNGTTWSAAGAGFNASIRAFAVSGTDLYAGGLFTDAGGISAADRIVKINTLNSTYSAISTGVEGNVYALAIIGSALYVAGDITSAGGIAARRIAKWDGTTWTVPGTGTNGTIYSLAVSGTDLYVGGSFLTAGTITTNRVAKWDGSNWSALGTGTNTQVLKLVIKDSNLYAGGSFISAGGTTVKHIAKWDGVSWADMSAISPDDVANYSAIRGMAFTDDNKLIVVGTGGAVPDSLRTKWNHLICPEPANSSDPDIILKIQSISNTANNWRSKLDRDSVGRTFLWSDLNYSTSADLTESYTRLAAMTISYKTQGTKFYGNDTVKKDIISALNWLYLHHYNENTVLPDGSVSNAIENWWDYKIGAPLQLNNITSLLYDELPKAQRINYMKAVDHCVPDLNDPTLATQQGVYTAANRVWVCTVIAMRAILSNDQYKLIYARDGLSAVFNYVASGDGFYKDGSFIQHDKTPYTGGYGTALMDNLSRIMFLFENTEWNITDIKKENVYNWIFDSFIPVFTQSGVMPMTTGREISRPRNEVDRGRLRLMSPVLLFSEIAPSPQAARIKSVLKGWCLKDVPHYKKYLSILYFDIADKLVNDTGIAATETYSFKPFPNMDQVVQQRPDYSFSISMHSGRIYNYEEGNGENIKGWYTGDGMTYLYNTDVKQFDGTFWPTVNFYNLPGTTVEENTTLTGRKVSGASWVGAAQLQNRYGAVGMELSPFGQTLRGKKSWFIFDNKIVALGAGILNNDAKPVNTYIEQRKLSAANDNDFTVNGVLKSPSYGSGSSPETFAGAKWAHLSGSEAGSDIGYYFPDSTALKITRKAQSGSWNDINETGDTTLYSNNYLTVWNDHGTHTSDDGLSYNKYSYVLLPNFSSEEVEAYSQHPDIVVLENNSSIQAVRDTVSNIVAANFWVDSLRTVKKDSASYITCDKKASVIVMDSGDELNISLSDPTMKNTTTITLTVNTAVNGVISADPGIDIIQLTPTVKIVANVYGLKGKSLSVSFSKDLPVGPFNKTTGRIRPVDLSAKKDPQIVVFPNPASGIIHIRAANYMGTDFLATLAGPDGNIYSREKFIVQQGTDTYQLKLAKYITPGVYILNIQGAGLKESVKLVVK